MAKLFSGCSKAGSVTTVGQGWGGGDHGGVYGGGGGRRPGGDQ